MLAPPALTLFHVTGADRLEAILQGGLKVGSERAAVGHSWADAAYGERPIYLTLNDRLDPRRSDAVLLAVDPEGLDLIADLPRSATAERTYTLRAAASGGSRTRRRTS